MDKDRKVHKSTVVGLNPNQKPNFKRENSEGARRLASRKPKTKKNLVSNVHSYKL